MWDLIYLPEDCAVNADLGAVGDCLGRARDDAGGVVVVGLLPVPRTERYLARLPRRYCATEVDTAAVEHLAVDCQIDDSHAQHRDGGVAAVGHKHCFLSRAQRLVVVADGDTVGCGRELRGVDGGNRVAGGRFQPAACGLCVGM